MGIFKYVDIREDANGRRYEVMLVGKLIVHVVVAVFLIIALTSFAQPLTIVRAGHVGVKDHFGTVADEELSPGLHLKHPFTKVVQMSVRTHDYTMSIASGEGKRQGDDSIDVLTSEGLSVPLDLSVFYRLIPSGASDVYDKLGLDYEETILRSSIRSAIRSATVDFSSVHMYSARRDELVLAITDQLVELCGPRHVEVENVLIRNVKLPKDLGLAIEDKLVKQQEAEAMPFVLATARRESTRKSIEAGGIAVAQGIIDNSLTPEYLRWYSLEMMGKLANSPNTTIIFSPVDQNGMPVMNLDLLRMSE